MNRKSHPKKHPKLSLIFSLVVAGMLVIAYFMLPSFHQFAQEAFDVLTSQDELRIKEWVSQFGLWGPVVLIVGMVIQMFMLVVPNLFIIIISILCYGPVWGSIIAWFGIFLSSTLGYMIGSKLSPITVKRFVSTRTQRVLSEFIRDYGMKAIVVIRLSTFSNDGLSIVAGLLKMEYRRFITATIIGITPLITIIAIVGRSGRLEKGLLWVGLILITCLVIYIIIDRRRKKGEGV